jgi:alkylation response protein AidB-like acyl-CoA dehydrogenase
MPKIIRRRDFDFLLYEVFDVEALIAKPAFAGQGRELFDAIIDTAIRVAEQKFEPCAALLDAEEPRWENGQVILPHALSEAVQAFVDAGFVAAPFDEAQGGMGLPYTIVQAYMAIFSAANVAAVAYPLLTIAAANLLAAYASEEQKSKFLTPMLEGRFFGTMCLSETQAGSSLADITTSATPRADGAFNIVGNKMWISAGEHELSENIVHLVLARIPGSPAGIKGISLFIVPRFRVNADGSRGHANDVQLAGLNHKMGYRGTVNTVLNFGENDACLGYLVGEENRGLNCMFHMMNEARIGVGLGATMLGYAGYQHSLEYAKERPQGRHAHDKDPGTPQVPIIEHADVRAMLLAQKVYVEGGLALAVYCARLIDDIKAEIDPQRAALLLDVLTPIAKAWPSEYALEANKLAIQVLGGYGYTRDYPVERFYRDNRLNPIHEGTNGIQALDLLGRKVTAKGGAGLQALVASITADIEVGKASPATAEYANELEQALGLVSATTMTLMGKAMEGDIALYLANATEYLHMAGHLVIAWMWLKQAVVASEAIETQGSDDFYEGKLVACRFFFKRELPKIDRWSALLVDFEDTPLSTQAAWL